MKNPNKKIEITHGIILMVIIILSEKSYFSKNSYLDEGLITFVQIILILVNILFYFFCRESRPNNNWISFLILSFSILLLIEKQMNYSEFWYPNLTATIYLVFLLAVKILSMIMIFIRNKFGNT